jgi:hypothetical protein
MQMVLGGSGHRILQARSTVEMGFRRVFTMIEIIIMNGRWWTRLRTETGAGSLQVGSTRPRRRYRLDYYAGATRTLPRPPNNGRSDCCPPAPS